MSPAANLSRQVCGYLVHYTTNEEKQVKISENKGNSAIHIGAAAMQEPLNAGNGLRFLEPCAPEIPQHMAVCSVSWQSTLRQADTAGKECRTWLCWPSILE